MHNINISKQINKRVSRGRPFLTTAEEQFKKNNPSFDTMNRADQISALKAAGFDPGHGDSNSGGALHMVTSTE